MLKFLSVVTIFAFSLGVLANEHFGVYLTKEGVSKILGQIVQSYNKNGDVTQFTVDSQRINAKISKSEFDSFPLVQRLNEIAIVDLDEDLPFSIRIAPMNFRVELDKSSIRTKFLGNNPKSSVFAVRFSVKNIILNGRYIEVCEIRKRVRTCDSQNSFYGKFENYSVKLSKGSRIEAVAFFNINTNGGQASLKLSSIHTNLFEAKNKNQRQIHQDYGLNKKKPDFDVSFKNFIMPPPILEVDGKSYQIDVSKLKNVILSEKEFLSRKLVEFAGAFLAEDLSKILNDTFLKELARINTSYSFNHVRTSDPFADLRNPRPIVAVDNTRVVLPIRHFPNADPNKPLPKPKTFIEEISQFLKKVFYQANFNLSLSSLKTKRDGDLLINTSSVLTLNNRTWKVGSTLGNNPNKKLMSSDVEKTISSNSRFDYAAVISEPIVNAILKMGSDQNIFDKALKKFAPIKGVTLKGISLYYEAPNAITAVADVSIKLTDLESNGVLGWIKNRIGAVIENNYIYFPLELRMIPKLATDKNGHKLKLEIESPFAYQGLKNTYNHPYKQMSATVEESVIETLKKEFLPLLDDMPEINLSEALNHPAVKLSPVSIEVRSTGHLIIKGNIDKIDLERMM